MISVPTPRLIGPADDAGGEKVWREVAVDGQERAALLVQWLDELVFLAETEDLVPEDTGRIELSDHRLVATVRGHRGRPRHLVKGAPSEFPVPAYGEHDLEPSKNPEVWQPPIMTRK